MTLKFWAAIAFVALIVIFTLQNVAPVEVSFFFWHFSLSRALLIFFVFLGGVATGWSFAAWFSYLRARRVMAGEKEARGRRAVDKP
ncbi:MAG TPA: LapA family protein [Syntrophales bacterium]|nr:LapA family protein [Syntrophales bacterium]HPC01627.1 LapA family protein [Syntrophales bacterium]HRS87159.1 LapA family protein [Syntrophales bacterium]HRV42808.1 LapA family protein [Syntrophales bacterium]